MICPACGSSTVDTIRDPELILAAPLPPAKGVWWRCGSCPAAGALVLVPPPTLAQRRGRTARKARSAEDGAPAPLRLVSEAQP